MPQNARTRPVAVAPLAIAAIVLAAVGSPAAGQPATGTWQPPAVRDPVPFTAAEYAARRSALADTLGDGVLIVFGSPAPAADYLPYAQNQAFRYLTGVTEPSATLVMARHEGRLREILFVQPKDPSRELWEGHRLGPEGVAALLGIEGRTNDRLMPTLDTLLAGGPTLFSPTRPPRGDGASVLTPDEQMLQHVLARHPGLRVVDAVRPLMRLRALKSETELDHIRRAVYVSVLAHRAAMREAAPGLNEFEIRGLVEYTFLRNGAEGPAYASIVGSGPNSTTLHYREANRFMRDGDVLLIDVGASYRGYAADVTRTIPVNGRFSPEQRAIYEIVLAAQKAAEQRVRLGATWPELNAAATEQIANGLARLGLIDAPDATYQCGSLASARCPQVRLFYMHGLGHGVGLAVHDPDISSFDGFRPGSAVTIEPGIYVRADVLDHIPDTPENRAMAARLGPAVAKYRDIGVRIEDVYIFDAAGVERASAGAPREIDEIEALMREPGPGAGTRRPDVVEWYRATTPRPLR
jgi:Xaa-Pro aminopeptidase